MAMGINCNDPNTVTYVLPDCKIEKMHELLEKDKNLIKSGYKAQDYPAEMPPEEFYVIVSKGKIRAFERAAKSLKIKFEQIRSE